MAPKLSSVSFFCPAYHDQDNLPILIPRVHAFLGEIAETFEIIIVHDASPDRTGAVADELAGQLPHVRVIHHARNMGYGATLRDGFLAGRYDYVLYTDGDNQYDVREIGPYLHLLADHDVLAGYVTHKAVSSRRKIQSMVFNGLIRILFFTSYRDINCALKLYRRRVLESMPIKSTSAFIDAEMMIRVRQGGFRVAQFPVTHFPRSAGLESGSRMSVIMPTVRDMLKFRLGTL